MFSERNLEEANHNIYIILLMLNGSESLRITLRKPNDVIV